MAKIRVLIVDDSLFFRTSLQRMLRKDPEIEIIGMAYDASDAMQKIQQLRPSVVTLDVEMPKMNGIEFLGKLLPIYSVPVVVVSSAPVRVFDALSAGAVDFVRKPELKSPSDFAAFAADLAEKIKAASMARVHLKTAASAAAAAVSATTAAVNNTARTAAPLRSSVSAPPAAPSATTMAASAASAAAMLRSPLSSTVSAAKQDTLIAIGASTGGTEATIAVVKNLPASTPGIVIVQHMPPVFTNMYAQRLNRICNMSAIEATDMMRVEQGKIIVAAGDYQLRVMRDAQGYYVTVRPGEKVSGHCPSVDVMFESVAMAAGPRSIGVLLTGMGQDGANGLLKMRQRGAYTIGQDQESCVVYGMPAVAFELGAVQKQLPVEQITGDIITYLSR